MELRQELIAEFKEHAISKINDGLISMDNQDDWHYVLFNEDFYIIGYWTGKNWLDSHNFDAFDAIEFVISYEKDNFGETHTKINGEAIANMVAYIMGEIWLYQEGGSEFIEGLLKDAENE